MSQAKRKEIQVMDKRIRKSKGANRRLTCGKGGHSHLTLDQTNSVERRKEGGGGGGERRERREKYEREAPTSLYDLRRSVGRFSSGQLRTKGHLLDKGYAWVPKT